MIEIVKPDGTKSFSPVSYSTTIQNIYIKGYAPTDVTVLEIKFGGEKYTLANQDILFVGGEFTCPNPNVYSEGLDLSTGLNTFTISSDKTIVATLNVILASESVNVPQSPDGIKTSRLAGSVEISFNHSDNEVSYYNIYASTTSGGSLTNFFKINYEPLSPDKYGQKTELEQTVHTINTDISLVSTDPLFSEFSVIQKDKNSAELQTDKLSTFEVAEGVSRLRVNSEIKSVELTTRVVFKHDRNAGNSSIPPTNPVGVLVATPPTQPLFYVATSVKVVNGIEVESPISSEVSGKPIQVTTDILSLPVVGRDQMATQMIQSIFLSQPDLAIQAGSVLRDVVIDPFLSEMERTRFLLDFCYRSSSFSGLLGIDDPLNEGSSIAVQDSQYKTVLAEALFVNELVIQNFIDSAFEKLASNFGVERSVGKQAVGEVQFYMSSTPTSTISIPSGTVVSTGSIDFLTTLTVSIPLDQINRFYNPTTKRYSVTAPVQALNAGSSGNLTTDQINTGAPFGLKVTNSSPTFGGTDTETNPELASRALSKLSSVDVGTKKGIERISREVAGVINSFVVDSENEFMQRDGGLGGKVDVWVRGDSVATVTDVYAPSYQSFFGSRFIPVSTPTTYRFRNLDATVDIPLSEIINRNNLGLGLKNQTLGEYFNLTNMTFIDYRTIELDSSLVQPSFNLNDIILGDWRSSITNKIILKRQPVREIVSLAYSDGTAVANSSFYNNEDPLQLGRSSKASDYVEIQNDTTRTKILTSTDEAHVFTGFYKEKLNFFGVDQVSIVVKDVAGSTTYKSPFIYESPDYTVSSDEEGTFYLQRTTSSTIKDGDTVHVTYNYLENIVVTYKTNLVLSTTQQAVNTQKNILADIVVKESIGCPVDIKATVVLEKGVNQPLVDSEIRFNLVNFINEQSLGGSIKPSEIVTVINSVSGVNYVVLPLTHVSFAQDSFILREKISLTVSGYNRVSSLSNNQVNVWAIDSEISNKTQDLGGTRGRVFIEKEEMKVLNSIDRLVPSSWVHKSATIIGNQGLDIQGIQTNNRILVALNIGDDPSKYDFYVDYNVEGTIETQSELRLNGFSFFKTGDFSFTYDEVQ